MKMSMTAKQALALAAVLAATAAFKASADQATPASASGPNENEKCCTGKVVSVDTQEHVLSVRSWMFTRRYNLGDNCTYALVEKPAGAAGDLQPGEAVTVWYQSAHGVPIATRVEEQPKRIEGMVTAIDAKGRTLTLRQHGFDKPMQIADGCVISLRDNQSGTLASIQPGDHVTITCDTPNNSLTARQISQTSLAFTGQLTALDLGEKTVKARDSFDHTMKFNLADHCAIVINGRLNGKLSELRPDEKLVFDYDTFNGVNVVNRIAPAPEQGNSMVTTVPGNPGYPTGY
jgi:hypothetical protein